MSDSFIGPGFFLSFYFCHSGITDKLMNEFENKVLDSKKAGRAFMDEYLKKVKV